MSEQRLSDKSPGNGCPICNNMVSVPVLVRYGYTIARCAACDTLHVSPIPPDEVLQAQYQDPGYFSGQEEQGYYNYADMRKALLPHFKRRLRVINSRLPARGRLLDFGCAAGYFLEVARSDGWQIAGVEVSRGMAQSASQALHIPIATSLDSLPEKDFDAITLWEVVEHLSRPVAELRRLYDRVRPGGLLMLSTPNAGHWQAVREPGLWDGYRPPAHLIFFTQRTLQDALGRAGFAQIAINRVSPLPPLPGWLRRVSAPLQRGLATGQAGAWPLALLTWRATRVFGWGWQLVAHPDDDIFTTLEAIALRPR
jgi:SAM-dependent methyltransferase